MNKIEVFDLALEIWGFDVQTLVLVEEMAELTKEIIKIHRDIFFERPSSFEAMIGELVDVQLRMDQIKRALSPEELDIYQREYSHKLNRVAGWLKEAQDGRE